MDSHQGGIVPGGIERGHCPGCLKENDYPAYLGRAVWHGECWDQYLEDMSTPLPDEWRSDLPEDLM